MAYTILCKVFQIVQPLANLLLVHKQHNVRTVDPEPKLNLSTREYNHEDCSRLTCAQHCQTSSPCSCPQLLSINLSQHADSNDKLVLLCLDFEHAVIGV